MAAQIDVKRLDDEVVERLERGESVEIVRDGEVIGRVEPRLKPDKVGWRAYFEARRKDPPLDDKFEEDMAKARALLNQPVEIRSWE